MFTLQTNFKPLLLQGGVEVKSVSIEVTVNSNKENFCPNYVQEFDLWVTFKIKELCDYHCCLYMSWYSKKNT
jgi:hypothetical protein